MIRNINKKFIASSIALTLLPSVLTGCTANTFRYNSGDNHEIVVEGTISYDYLKECYYVEIENPDYNKMEYYIASKDGYYLGETHTLVGYYYYDLLTNREIYQRNKDDYNYNNESSNETNRNFIKELKVEDYLLSENFIKNSYNADEVKQILETINENEQSKKLVKE